MARRLEPRRRLRDRDNVPVGGAAGKGEYTGDRAGNDQIPGQLREVEGALAAEIPSAEDGGIAGIPQNERPVSLEVVHTFPTPGPIGGENQAPRPGAPRHDAGVPQRAPE